MMKLDDVQWMKELHGEYRGEQTVPEGPKLKQDDSRWVNVGRDDHCSTGT